MLRNRPRGARRCNCCSGKDTASRRMAACSSCIACFWGSPPARTPLRNCSICHAGSGLWLTTFRAKTFHAFGWLSSSLSGGLIKDYIPKALSSSESKCSQEKGQGVVQARTLTAAMPRIHARRRPPPCRRTRPRRIPPRWRPSAAFSPICGRKTTPTSAAARSFHWRFWSRKKESPSSSRCFSARRWIWSPAANSPSWPSSPCWDGTPSPGCCSRFLTN